MIQTEITPNPDSLKFLSEKTLSTIGTEEFKKELEEEYGSVNINLADGTYEPIEKDEDKKEE